MNEQDLFDIMDGLPERQIAEAAEWKYRSGRQPENEIDSILKSGTMPEKITYRLAPPAVQDAAEQTAQPVTVSGTQPQPQSRVIRSAAFGLAAVAAAFALAIGGIAMKLHRDSTDLAASQPGTAVSDSEIGVTEITQTDLAALTVAPTGVQTTAPAESETTVTFSAAEPVTHTEDNTVSADELNFLGGHGQLRPVTPNDQYVNVFQDDEYIYFEGEKRIPKTELSLTGNDAELICRTPGCRHNTEDCLLYRYGIGKLICGNQDIYYCDFNTFSPKPGYAGGLKRIYSDGTTEDVYPQTKIVEQKGLSEESGIAYYSNIIRLGDTGIYLLEMRYSPFERQDGYVLTNPETVFTELTLLDSRTGETISLEYLRENKNYPMPVLTLQYNEEEQRLFVSDAQTEYLDGVKEIDIHTGKVIASYFVAQGQIDDWFYAKGKLHFLTSDGEGQPSGTTSWRCIGLEPGEAETVAETCMLRSFCYYNGRVYAVRHASVGMDAVVSYAPDGTDEQVIAETKGTLGVISQVYDPERITVYSETNSLEMYMTDPEKGIVKIKYDY